MPSRSGFDAVLVNSSGVPMSNISITVLKSDGTQATVYQSKTGTSIKAQPIVTDSSNAGLIQFWADPGYYQVRATDLNVPARIATRFIPFDAVAGDMNGGIDSDQITLTNEITSSMIQNDAITTAKIGNSQITTAKIADNNITTSKLVDGSVTSSKIASGAVTLSDSQVTTNIIANGAVTSEKIAATVTTTPTYLNGAVSGSPAARARKYADGLVVLDGGFAKTNPQSNVTYLNFPSGFRPDTEVVGICWADTYAARFVMSTNGNFSVAAGNSGMGIAFYLGGISFHAT